VGATVLEIGTRLGPYEITGELGTGGMGQVFKARDTRLDRTVAIKVSAEAFTTRFEREARAVAALNHPNICQLYDVGPNYLVLEHIAGTPVMPTDNVRKLLDVAVQIADGMAAAHDAGFVHRDLKPSNLLVTAEGRVKILDFGLVKTAAPPPEPGSEPALTVTTHGLVAGTVAYMSPEQARGEANLDARSDQFSFGLVLYEMATGKRPFDRATGVETLAAIVREDPEPLPATLPAPLRWIIERCLAKEPRDRYASSRDLYLELKSIRDHLSDASQTQTYAAIAPWRRRWRFVAAFAAGVVLAFAGVVLLGLRAPASDAELDFSPLSFEAGGQFNPTWSPDGRAVAFQARPNVNEPFQIYVRYLDSPVATQITNLRAGVGLVESWTASGRIVFASQGPPAGLWSISPVGGEPELVHENLPGRVVVAGVGAITSDGNTFAYLRREEGMYGVWTGTFSESTIVKYEPAPFAGSTVLNQPALAFSPDDKQLLLFWNTGNGEHAWLLPFPANASDPPRRILESLPALGGTPTFSWMPDNRHVVVSTATSGIRPAQLYIADTRSGKFRALSRGTTHQRTPAVSPDGDKLVFLETGADYDIVSLNVETGAITPLIATSRSEEMPAWNAHRAKLAYVTDRNGQQEIWVHEPGEQDQPLVTARNFPAGGTQWFMGPTLSPDGRRVIYTHIAPDGVPKLWISPVAGGGAPAPLTNDATTEFPGSWSPDGSWYVYYRLDPPLSLNKVRTTGQAEPEVLKANPRFFAGGGVGGSPVWSPNGEWILYHDAGVKLMSPDGATIRDLGRNGLCAFANDSERLYCLGPAAADGSRPFVSVNLDGTEERHIGAVPTDRWPAASLGPALRLTVSPDGDSVTYSVGEASSNLWLVEGLDTVALP
jgi:Tol biopolymer transport system component